MFGIINLADENLRRKIVFFTGAGISKESGIPTFDEMPDIRKKLSRSFAVQHPEEYKEVIDSFIRNLEGKEPNAAHRAIATVGAPVITMNVDKLHQKAGSKEVLEIHGTLSDNLVLYGDEAPLYREAKKMVRKLKFGDSYFIVVGVSFNTLISQELVKIARSRLARVKIINDRAAERVPELVSKLIGVQLEAYSEHK